MSNSNDQEVLTATSEIDLPPFVLLPEPEKLSSNDVESLERAKFEHKKLIDRWGFWVLVFSILLYFLMYLIEKCAGNDEMSKFTATISETMKFLISSLIGYLFASRP
jgi:hypothetical protein